LDFGYLFEEFPQINCPVFSFNIEAVKGNIELGSKDDRIAATISYILNSFFEKAENVAVYVCDPTDERHLARKRKFDIWFKIFNNGSYIKEDGVAIAGGMVLYNEIIFHQSHPLVEDLRIAFRELNSQANSK
jgi:hypothetical protein